MAEPCCTFVAPARSEALTSTFSKNRERLAGEEVALRFFDAVVREARALELLSDEHFSVDGTLIEAWAVEIVPTQ
jgi:transposase